MAVCSEEAYDVTLVVAGENIRCSRKLLAECSPYFEAMFNHGFSEENKDSIDIQGVESDVMKDLLQWVHTKQDRVIKNIVRPDNALSLLSAANMFHFNSVEDYCKRYILEFVLNMDTCLQIWMMTLETNLEVLRKKAKALSLWHFSFIKNTPAFADLPLEMVEMYLSHSALHLTEGEEEVFLAGVIWVLAQSDDRKQHFLRVVKCVNFASASLSDLRSIRLHPLLTENTQALELVESILKVKNAVSLLVAPSGTADTCKMKRALPLAPCLQVVVERDWEKFSTKNAGAYRSSQLVFYSEEKVEPLFFLQLYNSGREPRGVKLVSIGLKLYEFGGEFCFGYGEWNTKVRVFDTVTEKWEQETSLLRKRKFQSVCCLGDSIYLIGGVGQHRVLLDSVDRYDTLTNSWTCCAPLPHSGYNLACCAYKGQILVFGPCVYIYSPASNTWSTDPMLHPTNMAVHSAMVLNDDVFLTARYSPTIMKMRPQHPYSIVGEFTGNMLEYSACVVGDNIYCFMQDGSNLSVELFNISTNKVKFLCAKAWPRLTFETCCFPVVVY